MRKFCQSCDQPVVAACVQTATINTMAKPTPAMGVRWVFNLRSDCEALGVPAPSRSLQSHEAKCSHAQSANPLKITPSDPGDTWQS